LPWGGGRANDDLVALRFQFHLIAKLGLFQKKLWNTNSLRIANFDDLSSHGNHTVITRMAAVKPEPEKQFASFFCKPVDTPRSTHEQAANDHRHSL
jgi:hypothetical protein